MCIHVGTTQLEGNMYSPSELIGKIPMNLNPLARIERNIVVPSDLSSVTRIAEGEMDPELLGLTCEDRDAIWGATEALYKTGLYPAITLCIRRHGEVLLNRSIGHQRGNGPGDIGEAVVATPDMPMCLFSASKAITAMLIHLLEEQGELNVLNPVSFYIPEFGANGKKNITVQQILSHRAGIATFKDIDPEVLFDYEEILNILYNAKPTTIHGRELAYHAITGGYVLGELIQRITGESIREFMRKHIQEPLGFKYFNYGLPDEQFGDLARNYVTGLPIVFPVKQFINRVLGASFETAVELSNDPRFYQQIIPAGNIVATADECSRFFQCLLNGGELDGKRIFEAVTVERAIREVSKPEIDRILMVPMRYSAGMMLGNTGWGMFGPATAHAYGHLGLTNNFCWADPERATTVSILTSGNPLAGSHLPRLGMLLNTISKRCRTIPLN